MTGTWRRVRAGWYRRQMPDGSRWIHINKVPSSSWAGWAIFVNRNEFEVPPPYAALRRGFATLTDAKFEVDQHYFKEG
jgi:hypothetical protein